MSAVWLHHLDFNEIPGEKARWEVHKNAACSFEQILEVAPYRTAAVWPLTSNLTNHPRKMSKTCWAMLERKDKLISNILLWTPIQGHISVNQAAKTYIHQLCVDIRSLSRELANRDESESSQHVLIMMNVSFTNNYDQH